MKESSEEKLIEEEFEENSEEDLVDTELDDSPSPRGFVSIRIKNEVFFAILIPVVFIIGLFAGYVWRGRDTEAIASYLVDAVSGEVASEISPPPEEERQQTRYDIPVDDDPVLGSDKSPVTIIEFSDFQCPYCTRWHNEVFPQLIAEYGDQIRFVYRDLPLTNIHPEAFPAAEAANCANEQGSFWEYHDLLFSNGAEALNADSYISYAEILGLNIPAFSECVSTRRYADEVQADLDFALSLGIRSTPTFFINGLAIVGAQPYEVFRDVIESELARNN